MFFKPKMSFGTLFLLFVLLNHSNCKEDGESSVDEHLEEEDEEEESKSTRPIVPPNLHKFVDLAGELLNEIAASSSDGPTGMLASLFGNEGTKAATKKIVEKSNEYSDIIEVFKRKGMEFMDELATNDPPKEKKAGKEKLGKSKASEQKKRTEL